MMRRHARLAIASAVALAAGIAAFFLSRAYFEPEPPPAEAYQPAVVPEMRPDVTLADREGRPRSLSEWDGHPQLINFWATWCAPCRREIPMLNDLARESEPRGLKLIGIAIDFREDVLKYLETTPIDYEVLIGEEDGLAAARAFGMESLGLPFTVFVDRQGRIATLHVGELHRPQADVILSAVEALDSGRIDMPAARAQIRAELARIAPEGNP